MAEPAVPAVPAVPAEPQPREPLLEIAGASVTYGGVQALHGVSLVVPDGKAVCLLGPNGAGKTSLLRAASGLLGFHGGRITEGTIRYAGRPVAGRDAAKLVRTGIAQVLEGRHVFAELSVDENLRAGGLSHSRNRARAAELKEEVLTLFPFLGERLRQPAGLLSGGTQQMLAIGRALMSDPRLLLLDEPSLGLAPLVIRSIGQALKRINERGVSILLVEQSSSLAKAVAGDGYLIDSGVIQANGPTAQLLEDEKIRATYLGVAAR
jgi:branched-chain amino acid transport system ATP-binding protein